jgi:hypothetical protein
MKTKIAAALLVSVAFSSAVVAQTAPAAQPAVIEQQTAAPVAAQPAAPVEATLPSNTDVLLRLNDQLSTQTSRTGDNFPLTVVNDVMVDGRVVIPAGTRAVGQVTWRTGRGGFGKAGKMEIQLRYIELNGRRIPISGFHRQEGDGNTAGTVGAVIGAGIVGGLLVRGSHARIPEGREFTARTVDAIPVSLGEARLATIAAAYRPTPVGTGLGQRRDTADSQSANRCVRRAQDRAQGDVRRQAQLERECRDRTRTSRT